MAVTPLDVTKPTVVLSYDLATHRALNVSGNKALTIRKLAHVRVAVTLVSHEADSRAQPRLRHATSPNFAGNEKRTIRKGGPSVIAVRSKSHEADSCAQLPHGITSTLDVDPSRFGTLGPGQIHQFRSAWARLPDWARHPKQHDTFDTPGDGIPPSEARCSHNGPD